MWTEKKTKKNKRKWKSIFICFFISLYTIWAAVVILRPYNTTAMSSTTCLTSASQQNLNVPVVSSVSKKGNISILIIYIFNSLQVTINMNDVGRGETMKFLTPTLRTSRSPSSLLPPQSNRKILSSSPAVDRNLLQLPTPSFLFAHQHRNSPSSPRNNNIQDR